MFDFLKRITGHDLPYALAADAEASGLCGAAPPTMTVTEADLSHLPEPVRRYMQFMNVVGRPRDTSFRARFNGRFRLRPGQRVMPIEAWQYNTRFPVARLFHMRLDMVGFVPMVARDAYVDGQGCMHGKLLGAVPVADGTGDEFDIGELTTWLNDAILLCPSMLLDAATTFSAVDTNSFDVSFADCGRTVTARVFIDERGAPHNFSTTDRFAALPGGPVRAEWTTPIAGWDITGERPVPGAGAAVWNLPDGPFTYIDGHFAKDALEYNVEHAVTTDDAPTEGASPNVAREAVEVVRRDPDDAHVSGFSVATFALGATDEEVSGAMPGDEIVPVAHFTATRAVTIAAPPHEIWRLLVQVGVGRGGFYSYDLLDNLGRPSADGPLSQWQDLEVGDLVAPMANPPTPNTSFVVRSLERDESMVWSKTDSTWAWTLTPLNGDRTRLVTRIKQRYRWNPASALSILLCEFGDFAMMRKMLLGIKARAERRVRDARVVHLSLDRDVGG